MFLTKMVRGWKKSLKNKNHNKKSDQTLQAKTQAKAKTNVSTALVKPSKDSTTAAAATTTPTAAATPKPQPPPPLPPAPPSSDPLDEMPTTSRATAVALSVDSAFESGAWKRLEKPPVEEPPIMSAKRSKALRKRTINWVKLTGCTIAESFVGEPTTPAATAPSTTTASTRRADKLYSDVLQSGPPKGSRFADDSCDDSEEEEKAAGGVGAPFVDTNSCHFPSLDALSRKPKVKLNAQAQAQEEEEEGDEDADDERDEEGDEEEAPDDQPEQRQPPPQQQADTHACLNMYDGNTVASDHIETWLSSSEDGGESTDSHSGAKTIKPTKNYRSMSSLTSTSSLDFGLEDYLSGASTPSICPTKMGVHDPDFLCNGIEVNVPLRPPPGFDFLSGDKLARAYLAGGSLADESDQSLPPDRPSSPPRAHINRHVELNIPSWNFLDLREPSFVDFPRCQFQYDDPNYLHLESMAMLGLKLAFSLPNMQ